MARFFLHFLSHRLRPRRQLVMQCFLLLCCKTLIHSSRRHLFSRLPLPLPLPLLLVLFTFLSHPTILTMHILLQSDF
jgi:hypothetical protein